MSVACLLLSAASSPGRAQPEAENTAAASPPPAPPAGAHEQLRQQAVGASSAEKGELPALHAELLREYDAQKAKSEAAEKQEEKLKIEAAEVKNGALMSSGVTGGVAAVLQMKGFHNGTVEHSGLSPTAMPYLMLLPGYWGTNDETKQACASSWTFSDRELASNAALGAARKRARVIFDNASIAAKNRLRDLTAESIRLLGLSAADGAVFSEVIGTFNAMAEGDAKEAEKERIIELMARALWNPALSAYCAVRRFGIWVGYPIAYDADVAFKSDGGARPEREVTPLLAFGGGFSPNKYFTVLLGFTVSRVTRTETEALPELRRTLWATTLGLGGNLDIFTAAAK